MNQPAAVSVALPAAQLGHPVHIPVVAPATESMCMYVECANTLPQ